MDIKNIIDDPDFKEINLCKPEDFPEAVYKCRPCKDLGWIEHKEKHPPRFKGDKKPYPYTYATICECALRRQAAIAVEALEHRHKIFKGLGFDTYRPENESQREAVAICRAFIAGWPSLRVPEGPYEGRGKAEKFPPAKDLAAKTPAPEHQGLLFYGPVGTGKTSLLLSTAKALAQRDCTVVEWWTASQLAARLLSPMQPEARESTQMIVQDMAECRLLFLDDLGREPLTPYVQSAFFSILDERHRQCKPTFITTNFDADDDETLQRSQDDWKKTLELRLGEGLFSRVSNMCRFHKIEGRDRRRK